MTGGLVIYVGVTRCREGEGVTDSGGQTGQGRGGSKGGPMTKSSAPFIRASQRYLCRRRGKRREGEGKREKGE